MVKIYYLTDNTLIPKYIGKTKKPLNERLSGHKYEAKSKNYFSNTKKNQWFKKHISEITIHLIDEVENENWEYWEQYWIEQFKAWGFNLKNLTKGGMDDKFTSENKRFRKGTKKLKKSLKGRKLHPDHVEAIRKARTGWIFSDETKAKISKANTGKKLSDETKQKISKSKLGTPSKSKKPILQYDSDGNFIKEWDSITRASKTLKLQRSNIILVLKGKRNKCGECFWKYK